MKRFVRALLALVLTSPIWLGLALVFISFGKYGFPSVTIPRQFSLYEILEGGIMIYVSVLFVIILPVVVYSAFKYYASTLRGMATFYFLTSIYLVLRGAFDSLSWWLNLDYFKRHFDFSGSLPNALKVFGVASIAAIITGVIGEATHKYFPEE